MSYKAGVSVSTPYLRLKGQSGGAYRVSVGLGLPVLMAVSIRRFITIASIARECVAKGYHGLYGDLYINEKFYQVKL